MFFKTNGVIQTLLTNSETYIDTNSGFVQTFPVIGTVTLNSGEYFEFCVRRITGNDKTLTFKSYNLSMK